MVQELTPLQLEDCSEEKLPNTSATYFQITQNTLRGPSIQRQLPILVKKKSHEKTTVEKSPESHYTTFTRQC